MIKTIILASLILMSLVVTQQTASAQFNSTHVPSPEVKAGGTNMTAAETQAMINGFVKKSDDFNKPMCDASAKGDKEGVAKAFDRMGVELGVHYSESMRHQIEAMCPK